MVKDAATLPDPTSTKSSNSARQIPLALVSTAVPMYQTGDKQLIENDAGLAELL